MTNDRISVLVQVFALIKRECQYVFITLSWFWGDLGAIKVSTLCFTPHKMYPLLLQQMVLEDNIAAQFSNLSFTVIITVRQHFPPVDWYLYCMNKTEDVLTICPRIFLLMITINVMCLFSGEYGHCCCCSYYASQQQRWLVCVSPCTKTFLKNKTKHEHYS